MPKVTPFTIWRDAVAVATVTGKQSFDLRLSHTREAAERWGANTPVVSCSLPVLRRKQPATGFLRGYLPEGPRLQAAAERDGIPTNYTSELVRTYGLNLPGALVVTEGPPPPPRRLDA